MAPLFVIADRVQKTFLGFGSGNIFRTPWSYFVSKVEEKYFSFLRFFFRLQIRVSRLKQVKTCSFNLQRREAWGNNYAHIDRIKIYVHSIQTSRADTQQRLNSSCLLSCFICWSFEIIDALTPLAIDKRQNLGIFGGWAGIGRGEDARGLSWKRWLNQLVVWSIFHVHISI